MIWILFCACLVLSFVLSGMEAGVFTLSRLRIRQQVRAGRPSAKALFRYLENPENFLWTILVGNTLANFLILGWVAVLLQRRFHNNIAGFILVYAAVVMLFFTFFDLLPKTLFRLYPNRLCLLLARPFRLIHWALRPLVVVVESASSILLTWRGGRAFTGRLFGNREELRLLMQESAQALTSEEKTMINRVLDFQSLSVRQAMKPLAQVISVGLQASTAEVLDLCRKNHYTRLPVWNVQDGRPRVVGLVSCNTLLYSDADSGGASVAAYVRPAVFLDEDLRLELALRRLQRSGQRLAVVLGRDRVEIGIITLQDIVKAIFGEVSL